MNEPLLAAVLRTPYPGLRPFRREEADLFFGREEQVEDMLARLETHRFMAVVGSSGCGKSSLVQAGLLPALEEGFLSGAGPYWRMAIMRPGNAPFERLTEALLQPDALGQERGSDATAAGFLQATLRRGPLGLIEAVQETHLPEGTNLLLVVDQFEEIFRYREQASSVNDADAFVNLLLASTRPSPAIHTGQEVPIYVVITMRSDFIGDCAVFTGLPEKISDSQFLTPRLTRSQYRSAIIEPAHLFGGDLEPDLVNCMLNDLGDSPDQLPVLQHVLMRMWTLAGPEQPGSKKLLTLADYQATGGLSMALSRHADEALSELDEEQQRIAQILFRSLCERSQSKRDTRRPIKLKKVAAIAGVDIAAVNPVVEVFRRPDRSFIMPPVPTSLEDNTVLDISHESLISHWRRLNDWVEAEAKSAERYLFLVATARYWRQGKAALWREPDLDIALKWKTEECPNAAWAARYGDDGDFKQAMDFLEASVAERDKERDEKEQAHREKEQARQRQLVQEARAEEQARVNKRLKFLTVTAIVAFVVAVVLAIVAFNQSILATQEGKIALSRYLATESNANLNILPPLSLLLSSEAVSVSHHNLAVSPTLTEADHAKLTNDTERALRRALGAIGSTPLSGHGGPIFRMAFSPDGRTLASASADRTIRLWDLKDPTAKPPRVLPHEDGVSAVAFSRDGRFLASASRDGTIRLWDLKDPTAKPYVLRGPESSFVSAMAFNPDGHLLAFASADRTIHLWDLTNDSPAERHVLSDLKDTVSAVAFSPDGYTLAFFSRDGTIRFWDWANPTPKSNLIETGLKGGAFVGTSAAFSPNGHYFASASADRSIRLWDLINPKAEPRVLPNASSEGPVLAVAFSLDGHTLVSAGSDRTVRRWDLANTTDPLESRIFVRQQEISNVALSPDGHTLASSSWGDRTIRLWDLTTDPAVEPRVLSSSHGDVALAVAFSPDGHTLVSAGKDRSIRLWDLTNPTSEPQILGEHDDVVSAMAFSPDGHTLASAGADHTIRLWDTTNPKVEPRVLSGHEEAVLAIAFSPNRHILASTGKDRSIRLWDLTNPLAEPQVLGKHDDIVSTLAFSPDGRTLASAGADHTIRLWDLTNPKAEPRVLYGHEEAVLAIAFSPNSRILASTGKDRSIRLWDLTNPTAEPQVLKGEHDDVFSAMAFSPDSHTLAAASEDSMIYLWDLTAPTAEPRVFRGHESIVSMLTFSPDGRTLASASADRTIRVWRTQIDDLLRLACDYAKRDLTPEEWQKYLRNEPYHKTCTELPPISKPY